MILIIGVIFVVILSCLLFILSLICLVVFRPRWELICPLISTSGAVCVIFSFVALVGMLLYSLGRMITSLYLGQ